jgi:hypothetical protein
MSIYRQSEIFSGTTGRAFMERMLTTEAAETETSPHAEVDPFRDRQGLKFLTIYQPMGLLHLKQYCLLDQAPSS